MHIALLPAKGHKERMDWIQQNCTSFFECERMNSKWAVGKILYRFINEQEVTMFLLKWKQHEQD